MFVMSDIAEHHGGSDSRARMAGDHSGIHDDLMRFKPEGLTPNAWAMKAGVSRTVWSDMRRHGNPSRRTLEKLLTAVGSSLAEFEALRIGAGRADERIGQPNLSDRRTGWGAAQLPPLPLFATVIAGEWGDPAKSIELTELRTDQVVDRVARPVSLANDVSAYAITIVGDSMWPRFRPGRRVAVSSKSPVAIGDDVLVKLKDAALVNRPGAAVAVLIKELVRRSGSGIELRQYNPDVTFHLPAVDIAAIEKVLGELV
jgi:SOS-response transcriptional repressor LexA